MESPAPAPAHHPDPMVPLPAEVTRVTRETADTVSLHLAMPDSWSFAPGQFNMVYLFGMGEVPLSMSGDPSRRGVAVHTVRSVGSVTWPMTRLKRGAALGVRGPYGSAWPIEAAEGRDLLIIAGGIGLAPLRPVIHRVLGNRKAFQRLVVLYGARTPADILYSRELRRWRGRFDVQLHVIVDRAPVGWSGDAGVVTSLIPSARFDPLDTVAMICGPEVMMRFAVRELHKVGMQNSSIYVSMERNMKCALGWCGHCQYGSNFLCKDGPVVSVDRITPFFGKREI